MNATETSGHREFAERLKSARLRSGKSQEQIAEEVGTSRRHWIRWERGDHLPTMTFIQRIAAATGKPVDFFLVEEAGSPSPFPVTRTEVEVFNLLIHALQTARDQAA